MTSTRTGSDAKPGDLAGAVNRQAAGMALSIEDADARYGGRWVLLQVTRVDEYGSPLEGRLVAHGTRRRVYRALSQAAPSQRPDGEFCLFAAGALVRPGTTATELRMDVAQRQKRLDA